MCEALNAAGRDQKLVQLSVLGTSRLNPQLHCPSLRQSAPQPHTPQGAQVEQGLRCRHPPAVTVSMLRSWSGYAWFETQLRTCSMTSGKSLPLSPGLRPLICR